MSLSECSFPLIADWSSIKEHQHSLHWTYTALHKAYKRHVLSHVLNFLDMNVLITIRPTSPVPSFDSCSHTHRYESYCLCTESSYSYSGVCIHLYFFTLYPLCYYSNNIDHRHTIILLQCNYILYKNMTHTRDVFEWKLASYVWLVMKWGLPSSSGRSVSMSQPVSVTNRVCSNWAECTPSWRREWGDR